jgi:hypothetical protein
LILIKIKKKTKEKIKSKSKPNAPLRRQSLTGFSQSYSDGLNGNKRSYNEIVQRRKLLKRVLIALGLATLFFVGYLVISIMLRISQLPPESAAILLAL